MSQYGQYPQLREITSGYPPQAAAYPLPAAGYPHQRQVVQPAYGPPVIVVGPPPQQQLMPGTYGAQPGYAPAYPHQQQQAVAPQPVAAQAQVVVRQQESWFKRNGGRLAGVGAAAVVLSAIVVPEAGQYVFGQLTGVKKNVVAGVAKPGGGGGSEANPNAPIAPAAQVTASLAVLKTATDPKDPARKKPMPIICPDDYPELGIQQYTVPLEPDTSKGKTADPNLQMCLNVKDATAVPSANGNVTVVFPMAVDSGLSYANKVVVRNIYATAPADIAKEHTDALTKQARGALIAMGKIEGNAVPDVGIVVDRAALTDASKALPVDTWTKEKK